MSDLLSGSGDARFSETPTSSAFANSTGTQEHRLRAMASNHDGRIVWDASDSKACMAAADEIRHLREALARANSRQIGWQDMSDAPRNGKHCILCVKEGAFYYSVQGAYQGGQWNAVHRGNVEPLYWMPNIRLPDGAADDADRVATPEGPEVLDEPTCGKEVGEAGSDCSAAYEAKPIAHLVWKQGRIAADDVVDYYEVADAGDVCVDGSEPFPVWMHPTGFLHRLIENAFSWALQDCNYLNPKYMDRLIGATENGMRPELAAVWDATAREQAERKGGNGSRGELDLLGRDIYEVANQLGGYVSRSTPADLARFMLREAEAATLLADEIRVLRRLKNSLPPTSIV